MAVQLPDRTGEPAKSRCLNCQEKLPNGFGKTFGDNDDRAHRCPKCDTFTRIKEGSAAGLEVTPTDLAEDAQKQHYVSTSALIRADGGQGGQLMADTPIGDCLHAALEAAVVGYLRLAGDNGVVPGQGALEELLATTDERGSLTAAEIAEILATDELPVAYEPATWAVGAADD